MSYDPDNSSLESFLLAAATDGRPITAPTHQKWAKRFLAAFLTALTLMIATLIISNNTGCSSTKYQGGTADTLSTTSSSKGGQSQATTQQSELIIPTPYGTLTIRSGLSSSSHKDPTVHSSSESASTTQPSYSLSSDDFFYQLGNAEAGELPSLTAHQLKRQARNPYVWPVALAFVGMGAFAWVMQKRPLAIASFVLGLLTFLFPLWVGILGLGILLWLIVSYRQQIKELVQGQKNALSVVPPAEAVTLKKEMERAHSASTKKVVVRTKADLTT